VPGFLPGSDREACILLSNKDISMNKRIYLSSPTMHRRITVPEEEPLGARFPTWLLLRHQLAPSERFISFVYTRAFK
jgi:hypothetical protein